MKKMPNEGNQLYNFISNSDSGILNNYGSGSDFLTSHGSGSASEKVTVPTVPVPQHWENVLYVTIFQSADLRDIPRALRGGDKARLGPEAAHDGLGILVQSLRGQAGLKKG
jgi:hypothetical protein